MKDVYVAESMNGQVLTLDFCDENMKCERVTTFVCDTEHKKIVVLGTYYDCGWQVLKTEVEFTESPIFVQFGLFGGIPGIYIKFDIELSSHRLNDESVSTLWRENWLDNIKDYAIHYPAPDMIITNEAMTEAERKKIIWIGDNDYYA
ncbi:MAG: hypothetical protein NC548_06085 [Lachnospiraceae bacterium]|nr:hypothetical protein [Lachnospiraceae bacterium]